MNEHYFIGIDIGTQGARTLMLDERGNVIGSKVEAFPLTGNSREEQSPEMWWRVCVKLLKYLVDDTKNDIDIKKIIAIGVTSTSGTIIPLSAQHIPLHNAIMYSDSRSVKEADLCREIASKDVKSGFSSFNSSCGLPKMIWFIKRYPQKVRDLKKFIHASDYITGNLTGNFEVTDYTNVLKSGYDLVNMKWPEYITQKLDIARQWLQDVRPSGSLLGLLHEGIAKEVGLSDDVKIVSGITDGFASQIASGAVKPGQWNTTIGTTLVVKGVTNTLINDETGALYCHKHPEGFWMPGGASNTGADWITILFKDKNIDFLNDVSKKLIPTRNLAWPLMQKGERFPFIAPSVDGFWPSDVSEPELFACCMEGVAYIERYAYEHIQNLTREKAESIFTAGGGSNSDIWLKIRSNVLNLPIMKMMNVTGAAGAAILAASGTFYNSITDACNAMVHPILKIEPKDNLAKEYDLRYDLFIKTLHEKQILKN